MLSLLYSFGRFYRRGVLTVIRAPARLFTSPTPLSPTEEDLPVLPVSSAPMSPTEDPLLLPPPPEYYPLAAFLADVERHCLDADLCNDPQTTLDDVKILLDINGTIHDYFNFQGDQDLSAQPVVALGIFSFPTADSRKNHFGRRIRNARSDRARVKEIEEEKRLNCGYAAFQSKNNTCERGCDGTRIGIFRARHQSKLGYFSPVAVVEFKRQLWVFDPCFDNNSSHVRAPGGGSNHHRIRATHLKGGLVPIRNLKVSASVKATEGLYKDIPIFVCGPPSTSCPEHGGSSVSRAPRAAIIAVQAIVVNVPQPHSTENWSFGDSWMKSGLNGLAKEC
ncbi:hypothetical protein KCU73_g1320, partial [Aureobasidium melanogenum]